MATYSFKSSGKTSTKSALAQPTTPLPVGIKTPLALGTEDLFSMHYSGADQVHDNLRNLLLTNWGERLGFYYFGANLRKLVSEMANIDQFDDAAISSIRDAVTKWMPFVSLKDFSSSVDHSSNLDTGIVKITITYNVPQLGVENRSLQVTLYTV